MSIHKEAIDQPNARDKREKKEPTSIQQEERKLFAMEKPDYPEHDKRSCKCKPGIRG
jgi:hypothetical protein